MTTKHPQSILAAILDAHCAETIGELRRNLYKYTDCGATLGACINRTWLYSDDLKAQPLDDITHLSISSIVEGSEACTETIILALDGFETRRAAIAAYGQAVADVEAEANHLWNEANNPQPDERVDRRTADHIDGYDRDDLGESPDF